MSEKAAPRRRKRADGEGGIYLRPDGRYQVHITAALPSGERKRIVRYARTKGEANALRRQLEGEAQAGVVVSAARPPTVKEYGEVWLTKTLRYRVDMGDLSAATWNFYKDMWVNHIVPTLGQHRLDALPPPLLRDWMIEVTQRTGRTGRPLAKSTVRGVHATLRKALSDAVDDQVIHSNAMLLVKGPSVPATASRFLTREEAIRLRQVIGGEPLECLVLVLLGCGLRIGEALALRWSDIDDDAKRLRVAQAVGDLPGDMTMTSTVRPRGIKTTKTVASQASVPIPAFVLAALRTQRAAVARERLAAPAWDDQDLVFPTSVGTPKDRNNVAKEWHRLRVKAGLGDVRIHDLRHSTATFLLAAGAPMKLVQEVLRHSRMQTTADIYAHVLPEVKDEAASLLDAYLAPPRKPRTKRKKGAL